MTRRNGALLLGFACLLAGGLVAVLADDVRRWPAAIRGGDVQVRVAARRPDPWRSTDRLPFRLGERLLGISADLEYRKTVRLFLTTRPNQSSLSRGFQSTSDRTAPTRVAQRRLEAIARGDGDLSRRSAAANLRGVLMYETGQYGDSSYARQSIRRFREAIRIDPSNEQAKFNLELLLDRSLIENPPSRGGGGRDRSEAEGAGFTRPGRGY